MKLGPGIRDINPCYSFDNNSAHV